MALLADFGGDDDVFVAAALALCLCLGLCENPFLKGESEGEGEFKLESFLAADLVVVQCWQLPVLSVDVGYRLENVSVRDWNLPYPDMKSASLLGC